LVGGAGVGGSAVSVGGTSVGGTTVGEAGKGVSVGATGVLVGRGVSLGTRVGGTVLVTGAVDVKVGRKVMAGTGVSLGARARNPGKLQPRQTTPKTATTVKNLLWFMVCCPL
jgi:hypothetical protein